MGRRSEYQPKGGGALRLGSKCRYGSRFSWFWIWSAVGMVTLHTFKRRLNSWWVDEQKWHLLPPDGAVVSFHDLLTYFPYLFLVSSVKPGTCRCLRLTGFKEPVANADTIFSPSQPYSRNYCTVQRKGCVRQPAWIMISHWNIKRESLNKRLKVFSASVSSDLWRYTNAVIIIIIIVIARVIFYEKCLRFICSYGAR